MGLETISVGGEVINYFNVLEEVIYLRDVFFSFISGWATPFIIIIVVIWIMIFMVVLMKTFRERMINGV